MKLDIGISEHHASKIVEGLSKVLAETYLLYIKTQNFHWNVTGPHFNSLHMMFENQYTELATAIDSIAERIRALGHPAPASYAVFSRLSSIQEETGVPVADDMVKQLAEGHACIIRTARSLFPLVDEALDEATTDLLTQRIEIHEKTAWMLSALLGGSR